MKTISVKAVKREEYGKKAAKAVRREGMVPCVLSGHGESVAFSVDPREIKPLIYTPNSYIVEFDFDGTRRRQAGHSANRPTLRPRNHAAFAASISHGAISTAKLPKTARFLRNTQKRKTGPFRASTKARFPVSYAGRHLFLFSATSC